MLWQQLLPRGFCPPVAASISFCCLKGDAREAVRTSKKVRVALAWRSISPALSIEELIQGASRPPLKRLKYPPNSLTYAHISGIWDLLADSMRPCNSCRRYCDTVEPPCLQFLSKGRVFLGAQLTHRICLQIRLAWRTVRQRFLDPNQCQDAWKQLGVVPEDPRIMLQRNGSPLGS